MTLCFSLVFTSVTLIYSASDAKANEQVFSNKECQVAVEAPMRFEGAYIVDQAAQRAKKFERLTEQWRRDRGASSSVTKSLMSRYYLEIIGMGPPAVPLIVDELRAEGDDPDMWFWALQCITENDPTTPDDQGDSVKMAAKWLAWYDENYSG